MLAITLGDPLSINIESLSRSLGSLPPSLKAVLIGSYSQWCHQTKGAFPIRKIEGWQQAKAGLNFLDVAPHLGNICPTMLSPQDRGSIALNSLYALRQHPQLMGSAILTCPIDKGVCVQAGFGFPGQTEYFQDLGRQNAIMILAGPRLRVGLVTNHLPLSQVTKTVTASLIESKCRVFHDSLKRIFHLSSPRIAVVGLNPHCGDSGIFGSEDGEVIAPAVKTIAQDLPGVIGPIPADTAFFRAYSGEFDGVLAMYHDQGLGPLKTVHFYDAVNITGGLDFLRVSPDHGPAADKFGLGVASSESFAAAMAHCLRYLGYGNSGS